MTAAEQAALKADYRRDGYAVSRGFMSRAEVADINARIDALIDRLPELDEGTALLRGPRRPGEHHAPAVLRPVRPESCRTSTKASGSSGWPPTCSTTSRSRRSCSGSPSRRAWAR